MAPNFRDLTKRAIDGLYISLNDILVCNYVIFGNASGDGEHDLVRLAVGKALTCDEDKNQDEQSEEGKGEDIKRKAPDSNEKVVTVFY